MAALGLTGIGHVALKVADIGRSLAFYRDRLGFEEMMHLDREDGSLWLVYLRVTDTQFLELFPGGEGDLAPGPDRTAVNHFCLETDDLDATANALRAAGVPLTVEPKMGLDGNRQCWIADPDGNRIEFMEMGAGSMQAEAIKRLRATV
ncbi:MAG: VOC family protein [Rhizobiaceae bacterium]